MARRAARFRMPPGLGSWGACDLLPGDALLGQARQGVHKLRLDDLPYKQQVSVLHTAFGGAASVAQYASIVPWSIPSTPNSLQGPAMGAAGVRAAERV